MPLLPKPVRPEVPGHSDNVTFIAFAPYDDPEIAVAVVLQYGAKGTYSQEVAKDIFDAYFYGKTVDKNGELVFPSEEEKQDEASSGTSSAAASAEATSSAPVTSATDNTSSASAVSTDALSLEQDDVASEIDTSSETTNLPTIEDVSVEKTTSFANVAPEGG